MLGATSARILGYVAARVWPVSWRASFGPSRARYGQSAAALLGNNRAARGLLGVQGGRAFLGKLPRARGHEVGAQLKGLSRRATLALSRRALLGGGQRAHLGTWSRVVGQYVAARFRAIGRRARLWAVRRMSWAMDRHALMGKKRARADWREVGAPSSA